MNDEQQRVAHFGPQPEGLGPFSVQQLQPLLM